ncbi:MAG: type II secretion system protein [Pseudomonadota bacterium]
MSMTSKRSAAGFTLVEMSIVLVIIGMIVGGVSIGMNLQRSAESMTIKQKFIDGWVVAYNEYFNRTGTVIGDDQTQPTYMVAGLDYGYVYSDGEDTGLPDSNDPVNGNISVDRSNLYMICEGYASEFNPVESAVFAPSATGLRLHELMDRHGVRMPAGRAEGQEDRYVYLDNNGNPQELQVCFSWFPAESAHGSGNAMIIRGLTPQLARQLDSMVDGATDAMEGRFRQLYSTAAGHAGESGTTDHQQPNREWTGVNSINMDDGDGLTSSDIGNTSTYSAINGGEFNAQGYGTVGSTDGTIRDEDQVMRVTAVYLMDM